MMGDLAETVRKGRPETTLWEAMVEQPHLGPLLGYMGAFAADLGPDLLAHVPVLPGYRRLLDLGGSHGLHSIPLLPEISAAVGRDRRHAERPDRNRAGNRTGATDRTHQSQPGTLQEHDWGSDNDLVFYLSVAHNHSAEENRLAIRQIGESMTPGGLLVIHEYLAETRWTR
jgi:hypothetical protein